ncbi:unnamed protein product, partial [marine sediment metagenome]
MSNSMKYKFLGKITAQGGSKCVLGNKYQNDGLSTLKLNKLQIQMKNQIESKIFQNQYQFESVPCAVCNNCEIFVRISGKDRYGLFVPVVICPYCGLIQTNPRMTIESYDNFYNIEYRKLYMGVNQASKDFFFKSYNKGKEIYNFLRSKLAFSKPPLETFVFEVGC